MRYDLYVYRTCPKTGIVASTRCAGPVTAEALFKMYQHHGYDKVHVVGRRFDRKKDSRAHVSHGRV